MIDKKTYKKMLGNITPKLIKEAHAVTVFLSEQLDEEKGEDAPCLSENAKSVFVATMLIEYGKIKAETIQGGL